MDPRGRRPHRLLLRPTQPHPLRQLHVSARLLARWSTSSLPVAPPPSPLTRLAPPPGVDLSECLQYPDFSVVVLYKKVVIGFGFMVPDVKYNEAYISFLLVHPEWRRAGIGTFMIYHLIQVGGALACSSGLQVWFWWDQRRVQLWAGHTCAIV